MKQLIIILSIALCIITTSFSQSNTPSYFINGRVDFYELLDIPHNVCEEEFFGKIDEFFRKCGVSKGYNSWQLYGYDPKFGTFDIVEFFIEGQPIAIGQGDWYNDHYFMNMDFHEKFQLNKK